MCRHHAYSETANKSVVFTSGMPSLGVTNTTLSVLTLAEDVHEHKAHRGEAFAGLTACAQRALAEAWKQCIKDEGDVKITTLPEISETIVVRRVELPKLSRQVRCYISEGADDLTSRWWIARHNTRITACACTVMFGYCRTLRSITVPRAYGSLPEQHRPLSRLEGSVQTGPRQLD